MALLPAKASITAHESRCERQFIFDVVGVRIKISQNLLNLPHKRLIVQVYIYIDIGKKQNFLELADLIVWVFRVEKFVIIDCLTDLKLKLLVDYPLGSLA